MKPLNNKKQQIKGGTSQIGCSRVNIARNTNAEELQRINTEIYVAKEYLRKAKNRNEELKESFDESATHLEKFIIKFPHQTRESLMVHAKAILQPAPDYYNNLFHKNAKIATT